MKANASVREGMLTLTIAIACILVALILSHGYDPRGGLLWSITNGMYILEIKIGCEESLALRSTSTCEDGFALVVLTKYVLSVLAVVLCYGVGQCLAIFPSLKIWKIET